jgi:hypothetical protein
MNKGLNLLLLLSILFVFTGCAKRMLPDANFQSTYYNNEGSISDTSIAIVYPNVKIDMKVSDFLNFHLTPRLSYNANALSCALLDDIEKILYSKGIKVKYKIQNYLNMTPQEKKEANVLLYPSIVLHMNENSITKTVTTTHIGLLAGSTQTDIIDVSGYLHVKGDINIDAIEPLSDKKVWSVTIPMTNSAIPFKYGAFYHSIDTTSSKNMFHPWLFNTMKSIDKVFLDAYEITTSTIYRDINSAKFSKEILQSK